MLSLNDVCGEDNALGRCFSISSESLAISTAAVAASSGDSWQYARNAIANTRNAITVRLITPALA